MVKKAHFVTGKGGVGKSLVAALLARLYSLKTQQILLTELAEISFYKDYLNLNEISYTPTPWMPGVDVSQWSGEDCLKEYALHLLKVKKLYELFFENPVTRSLVDVAPGLSELAIMGKVTSSPRRHGPAMDYDQLAIDAFATGHFLALLGSPRAMAETIKFGPMGEQSRSIDKLIRDPQYTHIHIVTLAEELPITETLELCQSLKKDFAITPTIYLNKLLQLSAKDVSELSAKAQDILLSEIEAEENAKKILKKNKLHFIELPLVTSLSTPEILEALIAQLSHHSHSPEPL